MNSKFGLPQGLGTRANLWSEDAAQTQGDLGYPGPASSLPANARISAVQSWHRQQVAGLRPAQLRVRDISHGERIAARAIVVQQKTSRPVQFEITKSTRTALTDWIKLSGLASDGFLFPSRVHASPHLSTRQYARIVDSWVEEIGLDPAAYGTHSIRRTKPSLIYRRTGESARCAAPIRPHEAREHGSLPWHRGRGRLGVSRADRGVTLPG